MTDLHLIMVIHLFTCIYICPYFIHISRMCLPLLHRVIPLCSLPIQVNRARVYVPGRDLVLLDSSVPIQYQDNSAFKFFINFFFLMSREFTINI